MTMTPKKSKRIDISAASIEALKRASYKLDEEEKEREGIPHGLPTGHPAARAMQARMKKKEAEAQAEQKPKNENHERLAAERAKVLGTICAKSVDVDKLLREIHDLAAGVSGQCSDNPVMKIRLTRISRMSVSFHSALQDCCRMLQKLIEGADTMKSEE